MNKIITVLGIVLWLVALVFMFDHFEEKRKQTQEETVRLQNKVRQLERSVDRLDTDQRAFESHVENIIYERY